MAQEILNLFEIGSGPQELRRIVVSQRVTGDWAMPIPIHPGSRKCPVEDALNHCWPHASGLPFAEFAQGQKERAVRIIRRAVPSREIGCHRRHHSRLERECPRLAHTALFQRSDCHGLAYRVEVSYSQSSKLTNAHAAVCKQ